MSVDVHVVVLRESSGNSRRMSGEAWQVIGIDDRLAGGGDASAKSDDRVGATGGREQGGHEESPRGHEGAQTGPRPLAGRRRMVAPGGGGGPCASCA